MKSVDHFLKIGKSHKVCEDYVISGSEPFPFVILSDGCSSSQNTDMGARILTHMAKQYLINETKVLDIDLINYNYMMANWIIHSSEDIRKKMGLNKSSLDATLLILYIHNNSVYTYIYGDGFLITVDMEDRISFYEISFSNNTPYYLSYKVDPIRNRLFNESYPKKTITTPDEKLLGSYCSHAFTKILPIENYKGIFIASDGINSFINEVGELYSIENVLKEVTAFKNINGEFIKRRMGSKKGVINTFQNMGINHYDDLSIGGFIKGK